MVHSVVVEMRGEANRPEQRYQCAVWAGYRRGNGMYTDEIFFVVCTDACTRCLLNCCQKLFWFCYRVLREMWQWSRMEKCLALVFRPTCQYNPTCRTSQQ